jgi:hypothetical protein
MALSQQLSAAVKDFIAAIVMELGEDAACAPQVDSGERLDVRHAKPSVGCSTHCVCHYVAPQPEIA